MGSCTALFWFKIPSAYFMENNVYPAWAFRYDV